MTNLRIGTRGIAAGAPAYVIAELSANHGGSIERAIETVRAAAAAGADAVKLQTYTPDTMTIDCDNHYFRIDDGTIWDGRKLFDLYAEAQTPWEWQPQLKNVAQECGIECFSSPFDTTAVDFLERMNVAAYKIASFEITDIPLISYVAARRKPVLISTGIAAPEEIHDAIEACRRQGNDQIVLLKCTSSYPASLEDMNLRAIVTLAERFRVPVGLSDHTLAATVPPAAVALGACVIEKHFILDRKHGGPDAAFSLEPAEFAAMVTAVRDVEKALGSGMLPAAPVTGRRFARSLFVVRDMRAGECFTPETVRSIRPGNGLLPKHLPDVLGKKARADIARGTPLTWDLII